MTVFQIAALLITAAALGGYVNAKFVGLPSTIAHMAFALLFSGLVIGAGELGLLNTDTIRETVKAIDFSEVLLHGMLSFLLFAGALHINLQDLGKVKYPVGILATFGVVVATLIAGSLTWAAARWIGIDLPYIYALLFGALISPTDPIAVLSILKQLGVSKTLYVKIGGESLFNDGVGVVIFLAILSTATSLTPFEISDFLEHLALESLGGLGLGSALGWVTLRFIGSIDDRKLAVMLTLALVMGGYALAEFLHVSGPLAMVAAGLIIGNKSRSVESENEHNQLEMFWELLDDVLNAVLFLLIGLEIIVVPLTWETMQLGLLTVFAVLAARLISVAIPVSLMRRARNFERGTIRLMTWGGLRGGLSIAMALSLPEGAEKSLILTLTYTVVLFSILIQGLSFKRVSRMVLKQPA